MKENTHPEYRDVVFLDMSCDFSFVTRSTVQTRDKIKWKDGKEYPLFKLETSSESHPQWTGLHKNLDIAGNIEKFNKKFGTKMGKSPAAGGAAAAA